LWTPSLHRIVRREPLVHPEKCVDKYFTGVTITEITVTEMTRIASSTFALQGPPADRAAAREDACRQMERMSKAMVEEKGLLNHAQAALMLDVSTKRVGELVRLGKLTDFVFLGRKYVSMREVWERNTQELKAGRPPGSIGKRVAASLKAAAKTDSAQASLGGYAGSYFKKQREEANERRRAEFRKKWREILELRRNERNE
jgi:hypothetical protein